MMGVLIAKGTFNRTSMELKLSHEIHHPNIRLAFNRTSMELKRFYKVLDIEDVVELLIEPVWN